MKSQNSNDSDSATRKLKALSELRKKLEENQGRDAPGYVTVSGETLRTLSDAPPPGFYDAGRTAGSPIKEPEKVPPTDVDYDMQPIEENRQPPVGSKAPWTPEEKAWLENPSLMEIYCEDDSEIPPRVRQRCENFIESKRAERLSGFWRAFSQ